MLMKSSFLLYGALKNLVFTRKNQSSGSIVDWFEPVKLLIKVDDDD